MKKRVISITTALVLVVSILFAAMDASASGVTAQENGFTDVGFSNGFRGYCLDCKLEGAYSGKEYTISDTSAAKSNEGGEDLSQTLKALFTQCFTDLFEKDEDGGYAISNTTIQSDLQFVIYHHTDPSQYSYLWGEKAELENKAKAYDGPAIPDSGYTITLDNGDVITFEFMVMKTSDAESQDFFAYKIDVNPAGGHTHTYGENWTTDEEKHWKECSCGDKIDKEAHTGGKATCVDKAVCEKCETEYGTKDKENHVGEVEVRDALEPTTEAPGYTGDAYCKSCGNLLEEGTVIPQLDPSPEDGKTPSEEETKPEEDGTTSEEEKETTSTEEEKAPTKKPEKDNPDTGDNSKVWAYFAVAVISLVGCVICFKTKKNANI